MEAGVLDWSRDGKIIVALGAKELSNIFDPRDPSTNDFWFVKYRAEQELQILPLDDTSHVQNQLASRLGIL